MTKLLYMEDFEVLDCNAEVVKLEDFEGKKVVILDQTCFYPRGGGQDFDQGEIVSSGGAKFKVEAVFYVDGEVKHVGEFESGEFKLGDQVSGAVLKDRRELNTKLHSAGHTIDIAVKSLGYDWTAGKGAHYPHMAFVEYTGEFDAESKDEYVSNIQAKLDDLVAKGSTNHIEFLTTEQMGEKGVEVPENMPKDKPSRVMIYDDFAIACGGTHVRNINQIGKVKITKIKKKDGAIRVSYELA